MARVAILLEKLFEDNELHYPRLRLIEAGHDVDIVAPEVGPLYTGKYGTKQGANVPAKEAKASDYALVVIPGGSSPDHMRRDEHLVRLVKEAGQQQIPMAAICHGPWMLTTADVVKGRRCTSFFSIKDDLEHAGATWVDEATVVDGPIITARHPDDLGHFMQAILAVLDGGTPQSVEGKPLAPDWAKA
jgi:protease I